MIATVLPETAQAGGYDTPTVYSARQLGMGGAAVSYVDDPSAIFHNPAGLINGEGLQVFGDFTLALASLKAAPAAGVGAIDANGIAAPFFMVGASWQMFEHFAIGWALYPVASASAAYDYQIGGMDVKDDLTLVFLEFSPGFAFELGHGFRLGATWRITQVSLDRNTGVVGADPATQLQASGWSYGGFRLGLQWSNDDDDVHLGLAYRHRTRTEISGDGGRALSTDLVGVRTAFTLPARISGGIRRDLGDLSLALDIEYAFQNQNQNEPLTIILGTKEMPAEISVANIFDWQNAVTLRVGAEYRLLDGKLPIRVGYVFDGKTSSSIYPTAFGTPPVETHAITLGAGYAFLNDKLKVNLAYALRFGGTTVTQENLDMQNPPSSFSGFPGDYSMMMHSLSLDVSYQFDGVTF